MDKEAIVVLKEKLGIITDELYAGETNKGIADMSMVISDFAVLDNSIENKELENRLINDVLMPALEAMEHKDGLLLADIINYELMDILDNL